MENEGYVHFFRSLQENYDLSPEAISILSHELKSERYERGAKIVVQGSKVYDIIFLIEGVILSSFIREGREFTTNISMEGDVVIIPMRDRCMVTLTALEDSIIMRMRLSEFEALMEKHGELAVMGYRIFKYLLKVVVEKYFDFTGLEAKEAYNKFLRDKPELLRRVPLKYIAANLGITPSSLSRIRAGK